MGIIKDFDCVICDSQFDAEDYDDNKCPKCGQAYNYDEGLAIVLTKDQIELLRK